MVQRVSLLTAAAVVLAAGSAVTIVASAQTPGDSTVSTAVGADAWVSANNPSDNFGSAPWIRADDQPLRYGFFKFQVAVPSGATVVRAEFRCWAGSDNADGASLWTASNDWTEDGITWDNAPLPDVSQVPVGQTGPVSRASWATVDVTSAVGGSGTYTFVTTTASKVAWSCASRENNGDHPATLAVTTVSTPSSSNTPSAPPTTTPPTSAPPTSAPPTSAPPTTAPPTTAPPTTAPPTTAPPSSPPPSSPPPSNPPPAGAHKVLVIPLENHSESEAMAQMPHLAAWAHTYGQASDYHAITHPSLPNYLAIWGGSTFGVTSDCGVGQSGCVPSAPSVWSQTLNAGETAKAYQESMSSNCQTSGSGDYAPRHGPWPYWTDAAERAACASNDVPSGTVTSGALASDIAAGTLPVTGELTPNLCNDAHDCGLATADSWLASWIPRLIAGPDFAAGRLTIVITFDEDDSTQGNQVPLVVIDPRLSGVTVSGSYNHYSLTRWLDENAGVPLLRNAATAGDLKAAFGL